MMNLELTALLSLPRTWRIGQLSPGSLLGALANSVPGRNLALRGLVLELVEKSMSVLIHGVAEGSESATTPYRCAPQAFAKLAAAASEPCRTTLEDARASFRLLARLCPGDFSSGALLLGLQDAGHGLGFLVIEFATPLAPGDVTACGEILGNWFGLVLARRRDSAEMLGRLAELELLLHRQPETAPRGDSLRQANVGDPAPALDDVMREHIRHVLARCGGRISGPRGAARVLAVNANTLRARMRRLGLLPACRARGQSGV